MTRLLTRLTPHLSHSHFWQTGLQCQDRTHCMQTCIVSSKTRQCLPSVSRLLYTRQDSKYSHNFSRGQGWGGGALWTLQDTVHVIDLSTKDTFICYYFPPFQLIKLIMYMYRVSYRIFFLGGERLCVGTAAIGCRLLGGSGGTRKILKF